MVRPDRRGPARSSPGLTDREKYALRPVFGGLVDEVQICENAILTDELELQGRRFKLKDLLAKLRLPSDWSPSPPRPRS